MSDSIIYRTCKKCQQSLPVTSEFWHKDKTSKDGFSYSCKECAKSRARKWQHDNQEYANEQARQYYRDHIEERKEYNERNKDRRRAWKEKNRERIQHQMREYRQQNKERLNEYNREYRRKHPDFTRTVSRLWRKRNPMTPEQRKAASERACRWAKLNPERALNHSHIRRARIKANGGAGFFKADKELQLKGQGGNCWWCGKPMGEDVTIDHIRPIVRGGMHDPRNVVLAHKSCNSSKKDKLPHEWNGRLF
jgi:hypothetical protein